MGTQVPLALLLAAALQAQTVSFQSRTQVRLGGPELQGPLAAVVADFDKDGKPDLAVPNQGAGPGVLLSAGKGDGGFQPPRFFRTGQPSGWRAT